MIDALAPLAPIITALGGALGAGWWVRRRTDAEAVRTHVEGVYGPMLAHLTAELGRSMGRVEAMERQLDEVRVQLRTLRTEHDIQLRARDARIRELEDECDQLRVDLAAARERESALETRVGELERVRRGDD